MVKAAEGVNDGNGEFFTDRLVTKGCQEILALFEVMDNESVMLEGTDTLAEAQDTYSD